MSGIFNKDAIKEKIIENLKKVYDPEIPVDIYSLILVAILSGLAKNEKD